MQYLRRLIALTLLVQAFFASAFIQPEPGNKDTEVHAYFESSERMLFVLQKESVKPATLTKDALSVSPPPSAPQFALLDMTRLYQWQQYNGTLAAINPSETNGGDHVLMGLGGGGLNFPHDKPKRPWGIAASGAINLVAVPLPSISSDKTNGDNTDEKEEPTLSEMVFLVHMTTDNGSYSTFLTVREWVWLTLNQRLSLSGILSLLRHRERDADDYHEKLSDYFETLTLPVVSHLLEQAGEPGMANLLRNELEAVNTLPKEVIEIPLGKFPPMFELGSRLSSAFAGYHLAGKGQDSRSSAPGPKRFRATIASGDEGQDSDRNPPPESDDEEDHYNQHDDLNLFTILLNSPVYNFLSPMPILSGLFGLGFINWKEWSELTDPGQSEDNQMQEIPSIIGAITDHDEKLIILQIVYHYLDSEACCNHAKAFLLKDIPKHYHERVRALPEVVVHEPKTIEEALTILTQVTMTRLIRFSESEIFLEQMSRSWTDIDPEKAAIRDVIRRTVQSGITAYRSLNQNPVFNGWFEQWLPGNIKLWLAGDDRVFADQPPGSIHSLPEAMNMPGLERIDSWSDFFLQAYANSGMTFYQFQHIYQCPASARLDALRDIAGSLDIRRSQRFLHSLGQFLKSVNPELHTQLITGADENLSALLQMSPDSMPLPEDAKEDDYWRRAFALVLLNKSKERLKRLEYYLGNADLLPYFFGSRSLNKQLSATEQKLWFIANIPSQKPEQQGLGHSNITEVISEFFSREDARQYEQNLLSMKPEIRGRLAKEVGQKEQPKTADPELECPICTADMNSLATAVCTTCQQGICANCGIIIRNQNNGGCPMCRIGSLLLPHQYHSATGIIQQTVRDSSSPAPPSESDSSDDEAEVESGSLETLELEDILKANRLLHKINPALLTIGLYSYGLISWGQLHQTPDAEAQWTVIRSFQTDDQKVRFLQLLYRLLGLKSHADSGIESGFESEPDSSSVLQVRLLEALPSNYRKQVQAANAPALPEQLDQASAMQTLEQVMARALIELQYHDVQSLVVEDIYQRLGVNPVAEPMSLLMTCHQQGIQAFRDVFENDFFSRRFNTFLSPAYIQWLEGGERPWSDPTQLVIDSAADAMLLPGLEQLDSWHLFLLQAFAHDAIAWEDYKAIVDGSGHEHFSALKAIARQLDKTSGQRFLNALGLVLRRQNPLLWEQLYRQSSARVKRILRMSIDHLPRAISLATGTPWRNALAFTLAEYQGNINHAHRRLISAGLFESRYLWARASTENEKKVLLVRLTQREVAEQPSSWNSGGQLDIALEDALGKQAKDNYTRMRYLLKGEDIKHGRPYAAKASSEFDNTCHICNARKLNYPTAICNTCENAVCLHQAKTAENRFGGHCFNCLQGNYCIPRQFREKCGED